MKTLLSLFDYSGEWPRPFAESGEWDVICVDLKHGQDIMAVTTCEEALDMWGSVDGILIAVPCTDFTVSGSQYWPAKDASGQTEESLELVRQSFRIVDLYRPTDPSYYTEGGTFFWALENPVGRLPRLVDLWPSLDYERTGGWTSDPFTPWYFDPHEFAGWLEIPPRTLARLQRIRLKEGENVTAAEARLVMRWNAYTKRTGLWGDFKRPAPRPVLPVRCCRQGSPLQRFGGRTAATKEVRSNTPAGFARAFFAANAA